MKQFDIMWANLPGPIGRRPVVLLTRTPGYTYLNKVLIAAALLFSGYRSYRIRISACSRKAAERELRAKFCCIPALTRERRTPQNFMAWTIVRAKLLCTLSDDQTFSSFHQRREKRKFCNQASCELVTQTVSLRRNRS